MQGFKNQKVILALVVAISLLACQTAIREPEVIRVPPGLTAAQVERGIASAIEYTTRESAHGSLNIVGPLVFGGDDDESTPKWYVEARNPGSITAGCKKDDHYLRTMIRYDTTEVRVEIIGSENLLQTKNRIHENVYEWIADLEFRIRSELGKTLMRTG